MKKRSLIAIALMSAFSGIACAQSAPTPSGVTLYGILDMPVEHLTNVGAGHDSLTRIPGLTGMVPSRIGIRGSEEITDNLRAVFTLEGGIGVDTGTTNQGGRVWGRQTFAGLAGNWGQVSIGRQYSMLFWSQTDADILGPAMFGSGSLDSYLPNARVDNTLAYRIKYAGFDAGATYSLGRDAVNANSPSGTNCAGESAVDAQACRQWSALVKYDAANWGLATAYDQIKGGPGAFAGLTSSALKDRRATVDGWYRWNALKLGAGLISRKNDANTKAPKSDLWYLGASYNVTQQFVVNAEAFRLEYHDSSDGATLYAILAAYNFSKRTALYATAGRILNDGTLALSVSNAAAGGGPAAGGAQTGTAVGIRHTF